MQRCEASACPCICACMRGARLNLRSHVLNSVYSRRCNPAEQRFLVVDGKRGGGGAARGVISRSVVISFATLGGRVHAGFGCNCQVYEGGSPPGHRRQSLVSKRVWKVIAYVKYC